MCCIVLPTPSLVLHFACCNLLFRVLRFVLSRGRVREPRPAAAWLGGADEHLQVLLAGLKGRLAAGMSRWVMRGPRHLVLAARVCAAVWSLAGQSPASHGGLGMSRDSRLDCTESLRRLKPSASRGTSRATRFSQGGYKAGQRLAERTAPVQLHPGSCAALGRMFGVLRQSESKRICDERTRRTALTGPGNQSRGVHARPAYPPQ